MWRGTKNVKSSINKSLWHFQCYNLNHSAIDYDSEIEEIVIIWYVHTMLIWFLLHSLHECHPIIVLNKIRTRGGMGTEMQHIFLHNLRTMVPQQQCQSQNTKWLVSPTWINTSVHVAVHINSPSPFILIFYHLNLSEFSFK